MMELLEKLSNLTAPSGWEDAARQFIRNSLEALQLHAATDSLGNLYVNKRGAKRTEQPIVLTAHLDEPGLMVTELQEDGFVRFGLTGDTDVRTLPGKKVFVGESAAPAVIGLKPIHLTPKKERKNALKASDLYLDLGEKKAQLGDQAVFGECFTKMGQHGVLGKAMGRSVGCYGLLKLLERDLPVDIICVFTTQHYVGSRGAYGASARLDPEVVITLGLCPETKDLQLGSGPVVPYMEENTVFARERMRQLKSGAERRNQNMQICAQMDGKGDGGVWQTAGGGVRVAQVCCPVRYQNAPAQLVDVRDVAALPEVLFGFLEEVAGC